MVQPEVTWTLSVSVSVCVSSQTGCDRGQQNNYEWSRAAVPQQQGAFQLIEPGLCSGPPPGPMGPMGPISKVAGGCVSLDQLLGYTRPGTTVMRFGHKVGGGYGSGRGVRHFPTL